MSHLTLDPRSTHLTVGEEFTLRRIERRWRAEAASRIEAEEQAELAEKVARARMRRERGRCSG